MTVACNETVGATVQTISKSDLDGDVLTLSLDNSSPNTRFSLDPATGKQVLVLLPQCTLLFLIIFAQL